MEEDNMKEDITSEVTDSMSKVLEFLRERGVNEGTVERFKSEKMDVSAISNADDEILIEMGLSRAGDRLSLKGYCLKEVTKRGEVQKNETKERKRELLEAIRVKTKVKKHTAKQTNQTSHLDKNGKIKMKTIQLGWKHYTDGEYQLVSLKKGGGSRFLNLPLTTRKLELIKAAKEIFFPNGISIQGKREEMEFCLTNFQDETVEATITVESRVLPFNLGNYMDAYKIRTVRLYLQTRKVIDSADEYQEDEIELPSLEEIMGNNTKLIGSSTERQLLREEQDIAYNESLAADRQKMATSHAENNDADDVDNKVKRKLARAARVPPEPNTDFVTIRVRHITLGLLSRRFPSKMTMSGVYDWIGSLSLNPENFTLVNHESEMMMPESQLFDRSTLSMLESDGTPSMSTSDSEIEFLGFGDINNSNASIATLPDHEVSMPAETVTSERKEENPRSLDDYYASLVSCASTSDDTFENMDWSMENIDSDDGQTEEQTDSESATCTQEKDVNECLDELAKQIDGTHISKFNISRSYLWEGTKRAVLRKSFSPKHKVSVKFTDDIGNSEGAVDLGGPMREYFTLIIQWMMESQLFCGLEHERFLSFQHKCLEEDDYYVAGIIIAMSLVQGGSGPECLSPKMFEAIVTNDLRKVDVLVEDVYDYELKTSLFTLQNSSSVQEASRLMNEGNMPTVLDLAGTLQQIKVLGDVSSIVTSTARWFILGRAQPALESLKRGLSSLGVLGALQENPNAFRSVFCYSETNLTAESLERLFKLCSSPVGSTKAITESLVISRWHDYILGIEEGEYPLALSDILFFVTGCKALPPRKICPKIEFLHDVEAFKKQSKYPKANTCSCTLYLPVLHDNYNSFVSDITFGFMNGRGFGHA